MPEARGDGFAACVRTPFATLGITTDGSHVTGLRFLAPDTPAKAPRRDTIAFLACVQLQSYLDDPTFEFDLPLRLAGTHHRLAVWEAMQRIPAGKTRSYGEVAAELRSSARAVGSACGANPIALIVPCHRIVASGGRLGGFMGATTDGFELGIKRWLLAHESPG
jgi:methylated-DNA-[protein]-cysteine S-methyltransferase